VGSFVITAGKRICDKGFVEKGVKFSVNGVVKQPVPHAGFVNISWFGVRDIKGLIAAVFVGMMNEILVERYYIIHQVKGKFLNVFFLLFSFQKLLPGLKQVIQADNVFKIMSQLNFHKNFGQVSPPNAFANFTKDEKRLFALVSILSNYTKNAQIFSRTENRYFFR